MLFFMRNLLSKEHMKESNPLWLQGVFPRAKIQLDVPIIYIKTLWAKQYLSF